MFSLTDFHAVSRDQKKKKNTESNGRGVENRIPSGGKEICRAWNPCATEIYLKGPVKMRGIEFLGVHCK